MNTSNEFINNELISFLKAFPGSGIRYQYKLTTNTHLLEVVPNDLYFDPVFFRKSDEFMDLFMEHFPGESIYFVPPGGLLKIQGEALLIYGDTSNYQSLTYAGAESYLAVPYEPQFGRDQVRYYNTSKWGNSKSDHSDHILEERYACAA